MSGVQKITIGPDEAEQRLDRWFRRRWPHVGQGRIEKMCRRGEIRVDGVRVKPATRVAPGQVVRVPPLPAPEDDAPVASAPAKPVPMDTRLAEELRQAVLFKDEHLLVLNKPAGLAVQGGSRQKAHLGTILPALRFDRDEDPRLIHRLDRDTSGVLVLARTGASAAALGKLFRSRAVEKLYLAVVAGKPDPVAGTIRYGLTKSGDPGSERMQVVHPADLSSTSGARSATTDYRVLEHAAGRVAAVVLRPVTGRTHQLRAHMAALGCPIAGDGKYGGRGQENAGSGWGAGLGGGLSRKLHLHAARLGFPHPVSGREFNVSAPLPEHMLRTWRTFGWDEAPLPEDPFEGL